MSASDPVRRRPKDRSRQILVGARDLFVERGYALVSMSQLAERVGITASALYRHYANKAELLEAVVRDSFAPLEAGRGLSFDDALQLASRHVVAHPYLGVLWSREVKHLPDDVRADVRRTTWAGPAAYVPLLRVRRPDLSEPALEVLAGGVQAVLASPGQHSVRVTAPEHAALLVSACRAVVDADLAAEVRLERTSAPPQHRGAGRGPALQSVRERLLLAAMQLFSERGYQGTSMTDIGAAAGVTGPNLYGYFASKAALLDGAVERCTHAMWLDLDAVLAGGGSPADLLAAVVRRYVERAVQWSGVRIDLSSAPDIERRSLGYQREYVAEWVSLLCSVRPTLPQAPARLLVHIALAVVEDLVRMGHDGQPGVGADAITAMVSAALRAPVDVDLRPASGSGG